MTKDYIKRQFSNFYNEVIKGKFAKSEDVENLNTDDIGVKRQTVVFDINHLTNIRNTQSGGLSLENGVFTFTAPKSGNIWADYLITDSDLANSSGIGKVKINVKEVSGTWCTYFIYKKKSDGKTAYSKQSNYSISKVGEMVIDLDLNYLSVYRDYDGNGINVAIANDDNSTDDVAYTIVIDKYNLVYGRNNGLEGSNLTQVLTNINAKVDSTSNNAIADNTSLATPSGEKYIMQIKNDGSLVAVPKLPSNILYIGNSTLVAFGTHGMASTTVDDDYYAKVNAYLIDKGKTLTTEKQAGYDFENCTTDSAVETWLSGTLSAKMSNDRQLVIIQLGDNVNNADRKAEFEKSCGRLCSYIRENCPNARVAWVGLWYSDSARLNVIKNACNKYGVTFVDIHDLKDVAGNQSYIGAKYIDANGEEQTITQSGVASHPSDQGFTAIANRIITTLFE